MPRPDCPDFQDHTPAPLEPVRSVTYLALIHVTLEFFIEGCDITYKFQLSSPKDGQAKKDLVTLFDEQGILSFLLITSHFLITLYLSIFLLCIRSTFLKTYSFKHHV